MFEIIDQNDDFLVVNKSPNISVHKDEEEIPWVTSIEKQCQIEKLYLVHRLDKMTSGIVLLAKNATSARALSSLFSTRQIEKFYLALSDKKPKKKQGLICGDMVRSRRSMWKLTQSKKNPATTQFISTANEQGLRLFLCKPYTGKTHQIRVALNALGAPILGDPLYAKLNADPKIDRGYLHAYAMRFEYQNKIYEFVCQPKLQQGLGAYWECSLVQACLNQWQTPWLLHWPELPKNILYHQSPSI